MTLLLELLAFAAIIGGVLLIVTGRGDGMDDAEPDRAEIGLPDRVMWPTDVAAVRFATGLRGYRMAEVDEVLDRLSMEITRRDQAMWTLAQRLGLDPVQVLEAVIVELPMHAEPEPVPAEEPESLTEPEPDAGPEPEPPLADRREPTPAAEPALRGMSDDRPPLAWSWTPEPIAEALPRVAPGAAAESGDSDWVEPSADEPEPDDTA